VTRRRGRYRGGRAVPAVLAAIGVAAIGTGGWMVADANGSPTSSVADTGSVPGGPTGQVPTVPQSHAKQSGAEQSGAKQSDANQGAANQGRAKQGGTEQGRAKQGGTEQGRAEQGGAEQGRAEQGGAEQGAAPPAPVVGVRLPGDRTATVVPVTATQGALAVPDDPSVLGWWSTGARPGAGVGSVVVDGHVDSARDGLGVFAALRALTVGQRVEVVDQAGRRWSYRVTGRRSYPKTALADSDVFDQSVSERLVLVTCGGVFDRVTRHYADNVVVYARPDATAVASTG